MFFFFEGIKYVAQRYSIRANYCATVCRCFGKCWQQTTTFHSTLFTRKKSLGIIKKIIKYLIVGNHGSSLLCVSIEYLLNKRDIHKLLHYIFVVLHLFVRDGLSLILILMIDGTINLYERNIYGCYSQTELFASCWWLYTQ